MGIQHMSACNCPTILGDCIGVNSPITGLSSEAVDQCLFYAACSPRADAFAPPPLGGGIVTQTCAYTVVVGLTQAEADALAAAICGPQVPNIYYSNPVTVSVPCVASGTAGGDVLTGAGGDALIDAGGEPVEPVAL